jgi:hypothetical protein
MLNIAVSVFECLPNALTESLISEFVALFTPTLMQTTIGLRADSENGIAFVLSYCERVSDSGCELINLGSVCDRFDTALFPKERKSSE